MKVEYSATFYSNTEDNKHCFQAVLRMILKYFLPEKDFTWRQLEKASAKLEGLWTWPMAGLVWLQEQGLEIRAVSDFDYDRFIREGGEYLLAKNGEAVASRQIANSNIPQEQRLAGQFVRNISHQKRVPEIKDIEKFLDQGYLVYCNVNSRVLNDMEGFTGHFVLILGYDDASFKVHDPGPPPRPNRMLTKAKFETAWAYPNEEAKNVVGVKLV